MSFRTHRAGVIFELENPLNQSTDEIDAVLTSLSINTTGSGTPQINMNSNRIINLDTPVAGTDAANKDYVDNLVQGLDVKQSVQYITVSSLGLTGAASQVITKATLDAAIDDGSVVLTDGTYRILVAGEGGSVTSANAFNGIYEIVVSGANATVNRANDSDNSGNPNSEVNAGMFTFVTEGVLFGDTGWVLSTNDPITLGVTALTFTQFSRAGVITVSGGDGIAVVQTGNNFSVSVDVATSSVLTATGGLGDQLDITGGIAGQPLVSTGGQAGFSALDLSNVNAVTNSLPVVNGGTGLTGTPLRSILVNQNAAANTIEALQSPDGSGDQILIYNDTTDSFEFVTRSSVGVTNVYISITDGVNTQNASGSDTITFTGGQGVNATVGATNAITFDLDVAGLTDAAPGAATDEIIVFNGTSHVSSTIQQVIDTSNAITDSDFTVNGLMIRTGAGTYTNVSLAVEGAGAEAGLSVDNADGTTGNPTFGLDINNTAAAGENLAATDELIVFNASASANQKMTGQEIANGIVSLIDRTRINDAADTTFVDTDVVAGRVDITSVGGLLGTIGTTFDINAGGAVTIDGVGASNLTTDSGNLTLSTTTTGNISLTSVGTNTITGAGVVVVTTGANDVDFTIPTGQTIKVNSVAQYNTDMIAASLTTKQYVDNLVAGGVNFRGSGTATAVNAAAIVPAFTGSLQNGDLFRISAAGNTGASGTFWSDNGLTNVDLDVGDFVIYDGTSFQLMDVNDPTLNGSTLINAAFNAGTEVYDLSLNSSTTANQILLSSGTVSTEPTYGALPLDNANSVTNVLQVTNGGTGLATVTTNAILVGNGTSALGVVTVPTGGTDEYILVYDDTTDTYSFVTRTTVGGNSFGIVGGNTGTANAGSTSDTINIVGAANSGISTVAADGTPDTLTIDFGIDSLSDNAVAIANTFELAVFNGTDTVRETLSDIITALDLTTASYVTVNADTGSVTADHDDTLVIAGGVGIATTATAAPDTITVDLDINNLTALASGDLADTDEFAVYDADASAHRKVTFAQLKSEIETEVNVFQIADEDELTVVRVATSATDATLDKVEMFTDVGGVSTKIAEVLATQADTVIQITNTNNGTNDEITISSGNDANGYGSSNTTDDIDIRLAPANNGEVIIGSAGAGKIQADNNQSITLAGGDGAATPSPANTGGDVFLVPGAGSVANGDVIVTDSAGGAFVIFEGDEEVTNTELTFNRNTDRVDLVLEGDNANVNLFLDPKGDGLVLVDNDSDVYNLALDAFTPTSGVGGIDALVTKSYVDDKVSDNATRFTVNRITTSQTLVNDESVALGRRVQIADSSIAPVTVTLPTGLTADDTGLVYSIKRLGSNSVTVQVGGSELLDGAASHIITVNFESLTLVYEHDASTPFWHIV